jgi:TM2 domain-containing membrane protein YozV
MNFPESEHEPAALSRDMQSATVSDEVRRRHEPSYLTAYILWACLGYLGAHRFYLGKYFTGLLYAFSGGFFCFGWGLDFFLTYFLVKEARSKIQRQMQEKPEQFIAEEEATIAPWAESKGIFSYLAFPVRLFFFTVVPPLFVMFTVILKQYELSLIMLVVLVATGIVGSVKKNLEHYEVMERLPLMGEVLASVRRLYDYYYHNKPSSFLYYLCYPLLGFPSLLFSSKARQEFFLYAKIILAIAMVLMLETAFSYPSAYPPHLDWKDAAMMIFVSLFFMFFLVVSFLLPMVTTAFTLHLSGHKTQLRVLTVWALLLSVPCAVGMYIKNTSAVSFLAEQLLQERFHKTSFREELSETTHMFLQYHSGQAAAGEVPQQPEVSPSLTQKYRRHIGSVVVQDEANGFDVFMFQCDGARWYGVRLDLGRQPCLLYLMNSQGGLFRSWQTLPISVMNMFRGMDQQLPADQEIPAWQIAGSGGLLDEYGK